MGLLGEHGLESIHHTVKDDARAYSNVRNPKERAKLMFTHHNMKLTCDVSPLQRKRRKCDC